MTHTCTLLNSTCLTDVKPHFPQGIHFDPASAQTLRLEFARTNSRVSPKQQVYMPQQSLNLANASTTVPHARNSQCKLIGEHDIDLCFLCIHVHVVTIIDSIAINLQVAFIHTYVCTYIRTKCT